MKYVRNTCWLALAALPGLVAAAEHACSDKSFTPVNLTSAYTIHDDGTVTDPRTALMWQRCGAGQAFDVGTASCTGNLLGIQNRQAAQEEAAKRASFAGYDDWRLPNIKELFSLVELCTGGIPNSEVFPETGLASVNWWSNSAYFASPLESSPLVGRQPALQTYVVTYRGFVNSHYEGKSATGSFAIRLVRDVKPQ